MTDLFSGDDLYGVDMSLPIHERVEIVEKQVAKDCANATLAVGCCARGLGGRKEEVGRSR